MEAAHNRSDKGMRETAQLPTQGIPWTWGRISDHFHINTAAVLAAAYAASSNALANIKLRLIVIYLAHEVAEGKKAGKACSECVSGCTCDPIKLNGAGRSVITLLIGISEVWLVQWEHVIAA
jgi:hypothetical protein